jgi:peptidoglycan/xylan/chitin deacetylase (PgdA/CDA1 family)
MIDGVLLALGIVIYYAGLGRLIIRLNRRSPKVLMYHACDQIENDFIRGLSINTPPDRFAAHLGYLLSRYRIASLDDVLKSIPTEPTVAILLERGLPATCYLTTRVIGNDALIWLNELNWFLHRHPQLALSVITARLGARGNPRAAVIRRAIVDRYDSRMIEGLLCDLRSKAGVDGNALARTSRLFLDWEQVAEMSAAGMHFGNHTCSHPNLAKLERDSCREEIAGGQRALAHLPGAPKKPARLRSSWGPYPCSRWKA